VHFALIWIASPVLHSYKFKNLNVCEKRAVHFPKNKKLYKVDSDNKIPNFYTLPTIFRVKSMNTTQSIQGSKLIKWK